jgi:hypothetical protein
MWETLILKWFLPLKIQLNFKKPVEDVVTLGPMAQATLVMFELSMYAYRIWSFEWGL